MKIKLLIIFLFLFTSQVFAVDPSWTPVSTSLDNTSVYYADFNSISKNESGNHLAWTLHDDIKEKTSMIVFLECDCRQLKQRWLYAESYSLNMGKGKMLISADFNKLSKVDSKLTSWLYPKPKSINHVNLKAICNNI